MVIYQTLLYKVIQSEYLKFIVKHYLWCTCTIFWIWLGKTVKNKFLFTMMAYPGQTLTWTMLGQLCTALWDSQSRLVVIQPGIKPGSVVKPLALRCSALDRCATVAHVGIKPHVQPRLSSIQRMCQMSKMEKDLAILSADWQRDVSLESCLSGLFFALAQIKSRRNRSTRIQSKQQEAR